MSDPAEQSLTWRRNQVTKREEGADNHAARLAEGWIDRYKSPGGDPATGPRYGTLAEQYEVAKALVSLTRAANKLRDAVHDEGPVPVYHRDIRRKVKRMWPALMEAVDDVIAAPRDIPLRQDTRQP